MATATAFGLAVPPSDTMDMSSPVRHDDGDIDIDLDDETGFIQDEQMVEDTDMRPSTATDAEMDDDLQQDVIHEEEMSDPVEMDEHNQGGAEDDELIDYDDDELEDAANNEASQVTTQDFVEQSQHANQEAKTVGVAEAESALQVEPSQVASQAAPSTGHTEVDSEQQAKLSETQPDHELEASAEDSYHAEHADGSASLEAQLAGEYGETAYVDDRDDVTAADEDEYPVNTEHKSHDEASAKDPLPVVTEDGPPTPTDTGLHPVTLYFNDQEMPLFKSKHHPDGLLKNDNLASLSLAELMKHCKERLALHGEDIPEQKEAVLSFDHMALVLYESSRAAYECSLNDVLDTFLQLHQNDGVTDVPAMSLTLSLQLKFSSSLDFLKQLATTGHGISSVPGYHQEAQQEQNYEDHQPGDESYAEETGDHLQEYGHQQEFDHQGEPQDEYHYDGEQYLEGHEETYHDQPHDDGADYEHNGEHAEAGQYTEDYHEQLELPEDHLEGEHGPTKDKQSTASSATLQDNSATHYGCKSDDDLIDYTVDEDYDELTLDVSAAIATNARDDKHTPTGEYTAEDLIDWDDLTPSEAEQSELATPGETGVHEVGAEDEDAYEPEDELREYDNDADAADGEYDQDTSLLHADNHDGGDIFDSYPEDAAFGEETEEFTTAVDIQAELDGDRAEGSDEFAADAGTDSAPAAGTAEFDADELIDYDDDTTEEHNQKVAAAAATKTSISAPAPSSPLGKRSYEEDDDLIFDEEPTPKKARAS